MIMPVNNIMFYYVLFSWVVVKIWASIGPSPHPPSGAAKVSVPAGAKPSNQNTLLMIFHDLYIKQIDHLKINTNIYGEMDETNIGPYFPPHPRCGKQILPGGEENKQKHIYIYIYESNCLRQVSAPGP